MAERNPISLPPVFLPPPSGGGCLQSLLSISESERQPSRFGALATIPSEAWFCGHFELSASFAGNVNTRIAMTVPATTAAKHAFGKVCHETNCEANPAALIAHIAETALLVVLFIIISLQNVSVQHPSAPPAGHEVLLERFVRL